MTFLLLLGGCVHPPAVVVEPPLPDDVPIPREGGPIAGPRYVVDAPPAPEVRAEVPGQGALPPYVSLLRRDLSERMQACATDVVGHGAMLHLVLTGDGAVTTGLVARSSGDAAWDECLRSSVALAPFEPPPPELLSAGAFSTDLLFR